MLSYSNKGYAEITFDDIINSIIERTTDNEGYLDNNSQDDLNSNLYERLLRAWKNNQPQHKAYIECHWDGGYDFYLELDTIRNSKPWDQAYITIVYTPTFFNNNNGNILRFEAEYVYKDEHKENEIQYYNIDDLDQMIGDMNVKMPLL